MSTVQRSVRWFVVLVLVLGLLALAINALGALFGWLGGSKTRAIAVTIDSPGGAILPLLFGILYGVLYWFKSSAGFDLIKERLLKVVPAYLLLQWASRLLASKDSPAYGPLDALATLVLVGLMAWPLWETRESLIPAAPERPESELEPEELEPDVQMPPQYGYGAPQAGAPDTTLAAPPPGAYGAQPQPGWPPMGPPPTGPDGAPPHPGWPGGPPQQPPPGT